MALFDMVIGNTGEGKHEEIFFKKRGKLFYFYAGQWKEKGVGYIQIIFYRRLKTAFLKITKQNCTHLMVPTYYVYQRISSCMKIHPFQKSDKAFSWFAENELRYEHLCICFKTVDIAAAFKAAFEKVLNILKENKIGNITNPVIKSTTDTYPVTQQPYGTRSLPKADSWTCPVCYTNNAADKLVCVACQAKKPGSQATSASNSITTITSSTKSNANLFTFNMNAACSVSSPKSTFSGFTFWPSAVLKEVKPASTSIPIASSSGNSTANQFTLGENSAVFASVINQNNMFDGLTFSTVPMIKDKKTVSPSISVATSTSNSTANLFSFNQNSAVISSVSEQRNISQGLTFFTGRRIKKTKTDTKARGTLVASTKSEKCQASSYFGFSCVSSHSTAVTSSLAGLKPVCHYDRNQSVITTGRSAASTENNISKMNSVLPNISFVNTLYSRSSESFATFSNYNVCASNCASSSNVSAYSLPSHNNVSTEDQKMSTNIINDFAYKFATAAEVKPIVSLPALVEVKSSEDEKELFGEQAKLLRFDFDEKEWKKYCTGELKILYLKARKMGRISMRTGKLCTNQYIFPHMQLTPLANNNEAWIWYAEDVSDGELKKEMFAAKFKSTEIAQEFLKTFHACQSKLDEITEEKKLHLDDKFQPGAYMGNKKIFDEQPSTCTEKASPGLLGTIKHSSVGFPSEIKPLTQSTALPFFGLSSVAEASATAGFKSVFPANNAARGGLTQKSEISEIKSVPIPLATDSFESSASLSKFNVDLSASSKKSDASLFGSIERPKGCEFNFKGSLYGNAKTLMASIPTPSCIDDDDEEDEEDSFDKCLPPDVPLPPEADDNFLNEIEEVTFYGPGILFSFSDGDWKKQGIGNIKICVYRLTKKAPRLLMQEEGVSNLCADHYFTSNMELHGLKNSERVFFWLAVVHTVEGMRLQNLCVCFRTINIAAAFKTAFEEALKIAKENEAEVKSTTNASPVTQKPFGVTFLPKASSWTCQTCYVSNAADKLLCVACETKKRGSQVTAGSNSISVSTSITNSTANQFTFSINSFSQRFKVTSVSGSKNTLGVSTFSASPVMPEKKSVIKSRAMLFAVRKKYEKTCCITEVTAPKPWPFSGFSFKSPPTAVVSSSSTVQFIESTESAKARVENNISKIHSMLQTITPDDMFGSKSAESVATFPNFSISVSKSSAELTVPTSSAPLFVNVSAEGRRVSIDAADGAPEEFVRTAEFKPIVPLPALVDVKTVGEGEEKLFGERAELFRFDREGKEWKEWGIGELKILFLTDSKKYKILMRREQVLKIGANHYILPDMKLTPLAL
ncbi:E3 SUMO-protein ligase RanBP2-like [Stegodyphus dumicola]|uniref:E3 SUMO-protein ligase RanBP2-like n=1 Tax=Stegodyphus dumicola TaxID=202533 RepID=UPI0015B0B5E6|nr:E3 SUMO-protein ligase RanBP2-like [Stegodyphus dumicola]